MYNEWTMFTPSGVIGGFGDNEEDGEGEGGSGVLLGLFSSMSGFC